jgi:hypothetical protein
MRTLWCVAAAAARSLLLLLLLPLIAVAHAQHDAQLDYYGRRLATASSDRTVRIFDVGNDKQQLLATLRGCALVNLHSGLNHPLTRAIAGMMAPCGRCHGRIRALAGCWRRAAMIAK